MLVHLSLTREFNGRIYATGNPQACFELGSGQSEMTLRIPLGMQCGTVQQVSQHWLRELGRMSLLSLSSLIRIEGGT